MIKEAYVSFEVAKLLKEKGFDYPGRAYYNDKGVFFEDAKFSFPVKWRNSEFFDFVSAPTQQVAMRWLREAHNFHIAIMFSKYLYGDYPFYWTIDRMIDDKREHTSTATGDYTYKTYEDAVEAALKYCLENLV